ncbi:NADP-dependent phosphogluconate dehydrogenase [Candidatus Margulisiibacteriota bacterium]
MKKCDLGFIGLGKMGFYLAQKIIAAGYNVCVYDSKKEIVSQVVNKGAQGSSSVREIGEKLVRPRVVMLCVPAGKVIDEIIEQLIPYLSKGDTLVDLGNSFYKDSQRRAKSLGKMKIHYIDVGVSGGIEGAKHGACLMIGGDKIQVYKQKHLFKSMSRNGSYQYVGKSGSGHLVKGYHNLIEYGYLQSLAEGLESLSRVGTSEGLAVNLEEVCAIWNKGSIIESKILADAQKAFKECSLKNIKGTIYGQTLEEMKKLIKLANQAGVRVYSSAAAVKARINSRKNPTYSGKIVNAIRNVFGGHEEWKKS